MTLDPEIQKDIQFVRDVNASAVGESAILMAAANAEPYRQFIAEVDMLGGMTAEQWFTDEAPYRRKWQADIRQARVRYEGNTAVTETAPNVVAEEVAKLRADVARLAALVEEHEKPADKDTPEAPAPAETPAVPPVEGDESDADKEV